MAGGEMAALVLWTQYTAHDRGIEPASATSQPTP